MLIDRRQVVYYDVPGEKVALFQPPLLTNAGQYKNELVQLSRSARSVTFKLRAMLRIGCYSTIAIGFLMSQFWSLKLATPRCSSQRSFILTQRTTLD